jgi:hypothetical protein
VNLHREPGSGFLQLKCLKQSGLAPFETEVELEASFDPLQPEFGTEGATGAELLAGDDPLRRRVRIAGPGLVTIVAGARDENGLYREARLTLQALDRDQLDGLLQGKFQRMKDLLVAGSQEEALACFSSPMREKYRQLFDGLRESLPAIAAGMRPIELIVAGEDRARYRILRTMTINGKTYDVASYIHFGREDGLWRIETF